MRTLKEQLVALERRYNAGVISLEEYEQAVRERRSRVLRQSGYLAPLRKSQPTAFDNGMPASTVVQTRMVRGESSAVRKETPRDPLLKLRDAAVKLDRKLVAMGFKPLLPIKVVKAQPKGATVAERIAVTSCNGNDIIAQLKAAVAESSAE
jgi:Fe2+ transport system protein FeoA